jgi:hypothetical protein
MRRRSRPTRPSPNGDVEATHEPTREPSGAAHEAEQLAGYRLVRRIASGDRADVFLAARIAPVPAAIDGDPEPTGEEPGLVALRVYDAGADGDTVTAEVEAMAVVPALPSLHDLATLSDGRICVVVERIAGPSLASLAIARGFTRGEAVTILAPIAVALADLERHGFAHTRLALSDVLFDASGRPRLIGTGALRRLDAPGADPAARTALTREMYGAFGRLVDDIAALTRPAGSLDPVRGLVAELIATRPFRPRPEEIERMVFAVGTPAPVAALPGGARGGPVHRAGDPAGGGRVPGAPIPRASSGLSQTPPGRSPAPPEPPAQRGMRVPAMLSSFGPLVDETGLAEAVRPAEASDGRVPPRWASLPGRLREVVAPRRAALVVGALVGAAALVLALTLVPPADGERGAAAGTPGTATVPTGDVSDPSAPSAPGVTAPGSPTTTDEPAAEGEPKTSDEPAETGDGGIDAEAGVQAGAVDSDAEAVAATVELLRRREECLADVALDCVGRVAQAGSAIEALDRATIRALQAGETPEAEPARRLDEARVAGRMGAAWLVEVPYAEPERQPASILVMRSEAGWRLREIFGS